MEEFLGINKGFIISLDYIFNNKNINSYVLNKFILSLDTFVDRVAAMKISSCDLVLDIRHSTKFPIVGCIDRIYPNSLVNITPTLNEIHELAKAGVQIIYLDASNKIRPGNQSIYEFFYSIKSTFPEIKFIGEVCNESDIENILPLNFDGISINNDCELINSEFLKRVNVPIIYNYSFNKLVDMDYLFEIGFDNIIVSSKFCTPQYKVSEFIENIF